MKWFVLNVGEIQIDEIDIPIVQKYNWSLNKGYIQGNHQYNHFYLHLLIAERMDIDLSNEVDHKDGDTLNNQRTNLRPATRFQNMQNSKSYTESGLKGAHWNKRDKVWQSEITVNGTRIYLGYFETPEEAHEAYCEAADKYHGEFANYG